MDDKIFVEEIIVNDIKDPLEILNWYRNLYYTEGSNTERGIMASAINDLFMKYKESRDYPIKIVSAGEDEDDWVYCPSCKEILGTNESAFDSFYENDWEVIYCHKCGQAITLK